MSVTKKRAAKNEHIKKLSQQHHFNLVFCWKVRQGLNKQVSVTRVSNYVQYFWERYLQHHFQAEEIMLRPFSTDRQVARVIKEHRKIEKQVRQLTGYSEKNLRLELSDFVETLYDHIHYEERSLYPRLERQMTEEQIKAAGKRPDKDDRCYFEDQYDDPFWNN